MHFESDIDERSVCVPKFNNVGKVIEMQNIIREHEHEKKTWCETNIFIFEIKFIYLIKKRFVLSVSCSFKRNNYDLKLFILTAEKNKYDTVMTRNSV